MEKREQNNNLNSSSILEMLEDHAPQAVATCHHPNVYYAETEEEE